MYLVTVIPTLRKRNKNDTSLFAQKPYLSTIYKESIIEEDIDMKNENRNKNLPTPISNREAASENIVAIKLNNPNKTKTTTHVNFNDKSLEKVRFVKLNSIPAVPEHLTAKFLCRSNYLQ